MSKTFAACPDEARRADEQRQRDDFDRSALSHVGDIEGTQGPVKHCFTRLLFPSLKASFEYTETRDCW